MTSMLNKIDEAVDATTKASIHEPPEEEESLRSVKEGKGPKVQKDRVKRSASYQIKTGRESSHPVILDKAAQHARQANAELPIRTPPPPHLLRHLSRAGSQPALQPSQAKDMERTGILKTPSTRRRGATSGGVTPTCIPLLNKTSGVGMATCPSHTAIFRRALTLHRFMCPESYLETIIKGRSKPLLPASTSGTSRRGWHCING
jgi:hypothetical protein